MDLPLLAPGSSSVSCVALSEADSGPAVHLEKRFLLSSRECGFKVRLDSKARYSKPRRCIDSLTVPANVSGVRASFISVLTSRSLCGHCWEKLFWTLDTVTQGSGTDTLRQPEFTQHMWTVVWVGKFRGVGLSGLMNMAR